MMLLAPTPVYASRGSRLGAQLIDGFVILLAIGVAAVLMMINEALGGLAFVGALLFGVGYYLFADAMTDGQSFGKRALDMAVVHAETGEPCTFGQSFVRNFLLYLLGPIDWIFIFGARRQRLGDMLASTIVIEAPDGVRNWAPPGSR
jgi:uncharacterized RDD family membrane protein YckC